MDRRQLSLLSAERSALAAMISEIPPEDVIDRGSLQSRLEAVDLLITQAAGFQSRARARLTFRGKPVIGTHGIYADFGMKAVNGFTEAVAAVAASLRSELRAMGPIPNRDQNQLLITNTALGSFGFELEEPPTAQVNLGEPSPVEVALEKTQQLLSVAAREDDEALADSASELDQRAIDKIRNFVETLQANEAICALEVKDHYFKFSSGAEVARAIERMSASNLQETTEVLEGGFVGAMPYKRRTFEFRIGATGEIVVGRFAPGIEQPELVNRHIGANCAARMGVTRVGQGKSRYVLLEMPTWEAGEEAAQIP